MPFKYSPCLSAPYNNFFLKKITIYSPGNGTTTATGPTCISLRPYKSHTGKKSGENIHPHFPVQINCSYATAACGNCCCKCWLVFRGKFASPHIRPIEPIVSVFLFRSRMSQLSFRACGVSAARVTARHRTNYIKIPKEIRVVKFCNKFNRRNGVYYYVTRVARNVENLMIHEISIAEQCFRCTFRPARGRSDRVR